MAKKIAAGRGSFTVPSPVEGDVTPEGLHSSFLQISPFVASKMIDVDYYSRLNPEQKIDSESFIANLNELREFFGIKQHRGPAQPLSTSRSARDLPLFAASF